MIVKYNKPGVLNANGVLLIPGANSVDPKQWATARNHPIIKILIEEETIEEMGSVDDAPAAITPPVDGDDLGEDHVDPSHVTDADALKALNAKTAAALVKETVNLDLLKAWANGETRKTVTDALTAQIGALEAPPVYRDGQGPQSGDVK